MMTPHVDGNALAGPLSEVFSADMTLADCRCDGCGDVSPLAQAMVYLKPRAWVVRCHICDSVLMTVVQSNHRTWIDFEQLTSLTIPT